MKPRYLLLQEGVMGTRHLQLFLSESYGSSGLASSMSMMGMSSLIS